jgi:hydrogenase maturation factor
MLCQLLDLDVLGVMASGALLVTASPGESRKMIQALLDVGIQACEIGRVVEGSPGVWATGPGGLEPLPSFERDELARLFENSAD